MSKTNAWDHGLSVSADGRGLVGHAGAVHLRAVADRTGLTDALSAALGKPFDQRIDRGVVLTETAMAIALGATAISDIRMFEHTQAVFGPVGAEYSIHADDKAFQLDSTRWHEVLRFRRVADLARR